MTHKISQTSSQFFLLFVCFVSFCIRDVTFSDVINENNIILRREIRKIATRTIREVPQDCSCGIGSIGCKFDSSGQKICYCDANINYKPFGERCKYCDCGNHSKNCNFIEYKKVCECERGYAPGNFGMCTQMCNVTHKCNHGGTCLQGVCICLPGTEGPFCQTINQCQVDFHDSLHCEKDTKALCKYDSTKARAYCECSGKDMKFDDYSKTCKDCDCGRCHLGEGCEDSWISCDFIGGAKTCLCKSGFSFEPKSGRCTECDCGFDAEACVFSKDGKKTCICKEGYLQREAYCDRCDCGAHGLCKFEEKVINKVKHTAKHCFCEAGFKEHQGKCFECNCGGIGKCVFDSLGKKLKCDCDSAFAENAGKCEFCFCGPHSSCSFKGNKKICECALGYENNGGFCEARVEAMQLPESSGWKIAIGIVSTLFLLIVIVLVLWVNCRTRRNHIT